MATLKGNEKAEKKNGTPQNDTIFGLAGADTLNGLAGNDSINGGADKDLLNGGVGNDILFGDDGDDKLLGENGNDKLNGGKNNDILDGGAGKDTLDGGAGIDKMTGGDGDDYYFVDNAKDSIVEDVKKSVKIAGNDTVETILATYYILPNGVENLVLAGKLDSKGTGNKLANKITGNNANNLLKGEGGNDSLWGGKGIDTLDGGTGADILTGGDDSDTYFVDNKADKIVETENGGKFDFINSTISFDLHSSPNVEALQLSGAKAIEGTGNALANLIQEATKGTVNNNFKGMEGNDTLNGEGGNDTLDGGEGDDIIDGGQGKDTVVFSHASSSYNIGLNTNTDNGIDQVIVKYVGVIDDSAIIVEGKDILTNVEMLQFSDGLLAVKDINATVDDTKSNHEPTGSVEIRGVLIVGETLKIANSLKDADGLGVFSYQWLKNGEPLAGATQKTYLLTESDIGKTLKVKVAYTDGVANKESVISEKTDLIQAKPEIEILPNQLTADRVSANEGENITFKLVAPNANEGDKIAFNFSGTISNDDVLGGLPSAVFYVEKDKTAEITLGFTNDKLSEGQEKLNLTLLDDSTVKATVTIKDSSIDLKKPVVNIGVSETIDGSEFDAALAADNAEYEAALAEDLAAAEEAALLDELAAAEEAALLAEEAALLEELAAEEALGAGDVKPNIQPSVNNPNLDIDVIAPAAPVIFNSDFLSEKDSVLIGNAESGSMVRLNFGDESRVVNVTADGTWSYFMTEQDLQLLHIYPEIMVTAVDAAGNVSAATSFTIPTPVTAQPTINLIDGHISDGIVSLEERANLTAFIMGTAEPNSAIALTFANGQAGYITSDETGQWLYNLAPSDYENLSEVIATATATDKQASNPIVFTGAKVNFIAPEVSPVSPTIEISSHGASDAGAANTYFDFVSGNYNFSIINFGSGDVLNFPDNVAPTLINDNLQDGNVVLQWAADGQVISVTLTGLTASSDGALYSTNSFRTLFGADALV